jgi:large subunit ribosomal protein L25
MLKLNAQKRETTKKTTALRDGGQIPAVFYGKKTQSTPISINASDFLKLWHEAGEATIFLLSTDGGEEHNTLIHDVQVHPVTQEPTHVDFYIVEKGQKVTVSVPFEFIGEAPALDTYDATLVKVMHEIEIQASPSNLPSQIEIDITGLTEIDQQILVKDITLPAGVEITEAEPEEVVVLVAAVKEEEEDDSAPTEVDLSSIEVEEKGKKEEAETE